VLGVENRKHVGVVALLRAYGNLLPFQVVFTRTKKQSLPPNNARKIKCIANIWDLTFSANH
jgi:hypothetical protein